jgi:hypothetical protein
MVKRKMPLTAKGKKMLNILIREYGKKKGRNVFYSLEANHPDWIIKWRKRK